MGFVTSGIGIILLALKMGMALSQCPRPDMVFYSAGNTCYHFSTDQQVDWETAREECRRGDGDLLNIDSPAEEDWVAWTIRQHQRRRAMGTYPRVWIGLSLQNGQWLWVNGSQANYKRLFWRKNQPDLNDRACAVLDDMLLDDIFCGRRSGYICEFEPLKTGTLPTTVTSTNTFLSSDDKDTKFQRKVIFLAVIGGIGFLAVTAIITVICLSVTVRRLKQTYNHQENNHQTTFLGASRQSERAPQTLPRRDHEPKAQSPQFVLSTHSYAEPDTHAGYEKLNHSPNRYLQIMN